MKAVTATAVVIVPDDMKNSMLDKRALDEYAQRTSELEKSRN